MYEPKTYGGLKTIATIFQGLGGLVVVGGVMAVVGYFLVADAPDLFIGTAASVIGVIASILFYAASEGVLLAIDIADSATRTAYLLEQMRNSRTERRAASKQREKLN